MQFRLVPSPLGRWGECAGAQFNVGKGTNFIFSVQIGRNRGDGREQTLIN